MNPNIQRELIPREDVIRLIDTLNPASDKLLDAAQQWELLDESGHVPDAPSYSALLQHATDAQDLSRDVLRMTAGFARHPHSTSRDGTAVLRHLAIAATMATRAAPHFTETAECALALTRSSSPYDLDYLKNRMVIDHASARAFLRRASESLRDAVKELDNHLEFHRFLAALTPRETPAPPPPKPSGRHR
ncbi:MULTISPECIES: hypothetical protein [Streptomyces]|uniref:Uncharacterized protein n=1 Tax=Streptomyces ramulosus TaxID=47762 RepID=A0ABW1FUL9_9ACTN